MYQRFNVKSPWTLCPMVQVRLYGTIQTHSPGSIAQTHPFLPIPWTQPSDSVVESRGPWPRSQGGSGKWWESCAEKLVELLSDPAAVDGSEIRITCWYRLVSMNDCKSRDYSGVIMG